MIWGCTSLRRHLPWISSAILGLLLVIGGGYMVIGGLAVRTDHQRAQGRADYHEPGHSSIPGVLVDDAETARAQADVIKEHTLGTWGPYSQLPRGDPRRAQFIDGVTLRTALNTAVMGFGVTQAGHRGRRIGACCRGRDANAGDSGSIFSSPVWWCRRIRSPRDV